MILLRSKRKFTEKMLLDQTLTSGFSSLSETSSFFLQPATIKPIANSRTQLKTDILFMFPSFHKVIRAYPNNYSLSPSPCRRGGARLSFLRFAQGPRCIGERSVANPDVSGFFVGQIPVWPPDRLRLRLRMTKDEGLFG